METDSWGGDVRLQRVLSPRLMLMMMKYVETGLLCEVGPYPLGFVKVDRAVTSKYSVYRPTRHVINHFGFGDCRL